jgi:hypothetical protein
MAWSDANRHELVDDGPGCRHVAGIRRKGHQCPFARRPGGLAEPLVDQRVGTDKLRLQPLITRLKDDQSSLGVVEAPPIPDM